MVNIQILPSFFNKIFLPTLEDYTTRFLVYYGGAGSGKSKFAVQRQVYKCLKYNDRRVLVVRKVSNTIRDSIFMEFKTALSEFNLLEYCKVRESDFTITLPNGSEILFKGMDDSERIKSISNITDILIEEASELTLDDFTQLNLRLRSKRGSNQIVLMYNPVSKSNWVYKTFHEVSPPENCKVIHSTYKDNRFLPESYVESLEMMIKTNPVYYRIYALGEFASLGKTIYSYKSEYFSKYDLLKRGYKAYYGLDYGYSNDPTAFVEAIVDKENKRIYISNEHYEKAMVNEDIFQMIYSKGFLKEVITADSSEPKSIEELKRKGIRRMKAARKGKDSVLHGIQFIQQFELIVHPSCKNMIMELENYTWQKDKSNNEYVNKPVDEFNHLLDALRYGLEDIMPRNRLSSITKAMLGF